MSSRVLFSLPVNERPDILAGQIAHIQRFCPDSLICIHISAGAYGDIQDFEQLGKVPGVLINPVRLETVYGKGLFHVHAANFLHAQLCCGDIGHVALISSNELVVRPDLEAHIRRYAAGTQIEIFDPLSNWHVFKGAVKDDPRLKRLLTHLGLNMFFGGQAEGQFYRASMFAEMTKLFFRFFSTGPTGFETEEVLPQTMAIALLDSSQAVSLPFTFVNYSNHVEIDERFVEQVRSRRGFIFSPRRMHNLQSPHLNTHDISSIFAVKRIPREQCKIRSYIYGLSPEPLSGAA